MLVEKFRTGITKKMDLNCAETVLFLCIKSYNLNIHKNSLLLSSAFGGGMGIEGQCGALTGGIMILGYMFINERAHESSFIKDITNDFFNNYNEKMGSCNCKKLKNDYRTDDIGCNKVIIVALEELEKIIDKYIDKRIR